MQKYMKIGFVYPNSWEFAYPQYTEDFDLKVWCDSDDFIMKYPRAVMDLGVEPVLFYLSQFGKTRMEFVHKYGFRLKRIPVRFGAGSIEKEISLSLLREIRREKCDLLHFYSYYRNRRYPDMFDIFAFYCRMLRHPFVAHHQAGEFPRTHTNSFLKKFFIRQRRSIKRFTLNSAQRILAINKVEIEKLTNPNHPQYYGVPFRRDKVVYLPNIVDSSLFFPMEKKVARCQLNMHPNKKYLLYVGHFRQAKGIQHLINIMPRLVREDPNTDLILVGNGEYEEALRNLIMNSTAKDNILMVGPVPNHSLLPYYNVADVHVLPSYTESFGNVLIESMACNTPSIGSNVGGIPEVLSDGVGLLVPPKNEPRLLEAIKRVINGDFKINERKREKKLKEYSYANAGTILFQTYKQILKNK